MVMAINTRIMQSMAKYKYLNQCLQIVVGQYNFLNHTNNINDLQIQLFEPYHILWFAVGTAFAYEGNAIALAWFLHGRGRMMKTSGGVLTTRGGDKHRRIPTTF